MYSKSSRPNSFSRLILFFAFSISFDVLILNSLNSSINLTLQNPKTSFEFITVKDGFTISCSIILHYLIL